MGAVRQPRASRPLGPRQGSPHDLYRVSVSCGETAPEPSLPRWSPEQRGSCPETRPMAPILPCPHPSLPPSFPGSLQQPPSTLAACRGPRAPCIVWLRDATVTMPWLWCQQTVSPPRRSPQLLLPWAPEAWTRGLMGSVLKSPTSSVQTRGLGQTHSLIPDAVPAIHEGPVSAGVPHPGPSCSPGLALCSREDIGGHCILLMS